MASINSVLIPILAILGTDGTLPWIFREAVRSQNQAGSALRRHPVLQCGRISTLRHVMRNIYGNHARESRHIFQLVGSGFHRIRTCIGLHRPTDANGRTVSIRPKARNCPSRYLSWSFKRKLVGERGFEPPTPWSRTRFNDLLKSVEIGRK
jgi:hypothetical protein